MAELTRPRGLRVLACTFVPPLILLALAVILRFAANVPVGNLTRDRALFVGGSFYAGVYSTLGLVLWGATATICLFAAALIARRGARVARMFVYAALLSALLLADDMLMLHELVLPTYFGIGELAVLAVEGTAALLLVLAFRRELQNGPLLLFLLTGVCFALAVFFDLMPVVRGQYLLEDGFKLMGICGWLGFWIQRAAINLSRDAHETPQPVTAAATPAHRTPRSTDPPDA